MSGVSAQPRVTVVCPTYNSKATLRCALRSVLAQDLTDFEVWVMGDACTDGTEQVVAEFNDARLHWFNFAQNTGSQSKPNNEGLRRARGRYVAFIGHDDLWFPWHLSRLVEQIERTGADFVHDLAASIDQQGVEGVHGPPHERAGYARIYFPTSTWLHQRGLPDEIGYWRNPDELSWPIDFDFTRRAAKAGKKIEFVPSLGVLKFHSVIWKFYSRTGEPPQERWLKSMGADAQALSESLLAEIAARHARDSQWNERIPISLAWGEARRATGSAFKACLRELIYRCGDQPTPLGRFLQRRFRRIRLKWRVSRGLP